MRLDIVLAGGVLSFGGAVDPVAAYPWLEEVGALRMAAVAGQPAGSNSGESPSLEVVLRNDKQRAAGILGEAMRARATVYDDAGGVFFDGTVSAVALGRTLVLTVEA